MPFGQLVIGPPGSGKSTYCYGMFQFLGAIGRKASVVNLDPANDQTKYPCALDIRDFLKLEEVMDEANLGPNGGIMYAMEELDRSADQFIDQVKSLGEKEYILFDCPGQVELYTHHQALVNIFKKLEKQLDFRLVVVNLIDSYYITSASQYISVLLLALRSMLQLDLPHVNILSKIDILKQYGALPFNLDFYTEVQDLTHLYPYVEKESPTMLGKRYSKLTEAIGELVMDFGLVSFEVLAVEDKHSMIRILRTIDKASGYLFGTSEVGGDSLWVEATRQGGFVDTIYDIQERWIDQKEEYDARELEEQQSRLAEQREQTRPLSEEEEWQLAVEQWNNNRN